MLPALYAIVDASAAARRGGDLTGLAEAYLRGGARLLQIRAKGMDSGPFVDTCRAVTSAAHRAGALVVVNDRADIALVTGADGVHVGQTDLAVRDVRRLLGAEAIVGISTHTASQVDEAAATDASYLAVGPVFGTATKETGYEPVGLALVRYAATRAMGRPVVAIGGIGLDTARGVLDAGATSLAVIGDLVTHGDPEARARAWVKVVGR